MQVQLRNTADLGRFINDMHDRLEDLEADHLLTRLIVAHVVALTVRREKEPRKLLEVLRASSLWNLSKSIVWASGRRDGNERLREKTRQKHEQFFEEMTRALGQREADIR